MPQRDVAMFELGLRDYGSSWTRLQEALKVQEQLYGPSKHAPSSQVNGVRDKAEGQESSDQKPSASRTAASDSSDHSGETSSKATGKSEGKSKGGIMGLITRKKDGTGKKKSKRSSKSPDRKNKESAGESTDVAEPSEDDPDATLRAKEVPAAPDGKSSKRVNGKEKQTQASAKRTSSGEDSPKEDKTGSSKTAKCLEEQSKMNGKVSRDDYYTDESSAATLTKEQARHSSFGSNRKSSRDSPPDGRSSDHMNYVEQHHRSNGKLLHDETSRERRPGSPTGERDARLYRGYKRESSREELSKEQRLNGNANHNDYSAHHRKNGDASLEESSRQAEPISPSYYKEQTTQSTHPRAKRETSRQQQFVREGEFASLNHHISGAEHPRDQSSRVKETNGYSKEKVAHSKTSREAHRQDLLREKDLATSEPQREQQRQYRNTRQYPRDEFQRDSYYPTEPTPTYNRNGKDGESRRERAPMSTRYQQEETRYASRTSERTSSRDHSGANGDVAAPAPSRNHASYPRHFTYDDDDDNDVVDNRQFLPTTGQASRRQQARPLVNDLAKQSSPPGTTLACTRCGDKVYPKEMVTPKPGVLFHSGCFKCRECGVKLTLQTYFTNQRDTRDADVYCRTHVPRLGPGTVDGNALSILTSKNSKDIKFSRYGKVSDPETLLSSKVIAQKEETEASRGDATGLRYM